MITLIKTMDGDRIRAENCRLVGREKNCLGTTVEYYEFYNMALQRKDSIRMIDVETITPISGV